jgi:hypothetical protein
MAVNYRGRVIVFGGVAQDGTTVTSIVSQTATGWEQLSGSVPVSFGFATVLADDTVTVFPGRVNGTFDDVVPHVYNVEQQVTRSRHRSEEWLGARFDRRPGVTIAGRVFLFGGNASVNVGPGGRAQVEEVEARCFNGRTDRREGNVRSTELGDGGDGCPGGGFQHRSGTGISFVNDRASDTGSLQGAVDACNAHFGGNVCAQACITSCTAVTRGGTCSCSEALIWHFGNSGCFVSNPTPGTVTGANCTTTVIGTWN